MVQTYEEALTWIHSRLKLGVKPGLRRMEWLMERLEHPEERMKAIHIAGTNGKGSTVCYLRTIFQEAGYNIGTFTSPYFEFFNERISVNGEPISNDELVFLVNKVKPLVIELEKTDLGSPTEFEVITAMALYYFGYVNTLHLVIFETGLGGRLDSTNVIQPILSLITNVGLDHTTILGETITEIASEKAGIIKPGVPVITSVDQQEALQVIKDKANKETSSVFFEGQDYSIISHESQQQGERFSLQTPLTMFHNLFISMRGTHQVKNAALAVMAITYLRDNHSVMIENTHIKSGLNKANWIGRFEQIATNPLVIIDGAHNPEGVQSLVSTIATHLKDKQIRIILSALCDKKLEQMINPLSEIAEVITFTTFDFPRVCTAKQLYDQCKLENKKINEDWESALDEELSLLQEGEALVITGSLYFLSQVRPYILQKKKIFH